MCTHVEVEMGVLSLLFLAPIWPDFFLLSLVRHMAFTPKRDSFYFLVCVCV